MFDSWHQADKEIYVSLKKYENIKKFQMFFDIDIFVFYWPYVFY